MTKRMQLCAGMEKKCHTVAYGGTAFQSGLNPTGSGKERATEHTHPSLA
jgi:hypothetical protein